ncbi:MAG: hypothetical protein PHX91_07420 [Prevotella sp.]|nr:hypothetical protein [Prevotella sp.]
MMFLNIPNSYIIERRRVGSLAITMIVVSIAPTGRQLSAQGALG